MEVCTRLKLHGDTWFASCPEHTVFARLIHVKNCVILFTTRGIALGRLHEGVVWYMVHGVCLSPPKVPQPDGHQRDEDNKDYRIRHHVTTSSFAGAGTNLLQTRASYIEISPRSGESCLGTAQIPELAFKE